MWDADAALARGLVAAVVPRDELLPTAVGLARPLGGQRRAYVERAIVPLRGAGDGRSAYADLLDAESGEQEWSMNQPEFLAGLAAIRARIGRRR
ncbi:hypothetical protein [Dactylosporangium sp. CA-233914]|uniref:hypothetical protein n=1 Tax=Dactylosporangium sp. CA-233914 TaxID=3239934 RepID=UPI003D8CD26E